MARADDQTSADSPVRRWVHRVLALGICAWAFTVPISGPVHANSITNGDFESIAPFFANPGSPVTIGGWTFENFAGVESTNGNPGHGVRLEDSGPASRDSTIAQTVSGLSIGTTYRLSWDLALRVNSSGSGTGRSFGVFLDTQTFVNGLLFDEHLSTTYKSDSVDFVATATSHTLIFAGELDSRTNGGLGTTDVSYNLDNVDLSAVPESSSLILLGFALMGVYSSRLR